MANAGISFTPSGTETTTGVVPFGGAVTLTLPTVDASNPDLLVTNAGPTAIWLAFGSGALVTSNGAGQIAVPGGGKLVLTTNATVIAAATAAGDPNVISGTQASLAATSAAVSALAQQFGGTLTFARGVASAAVLV